MFATVDDTNRPAGSLAEDLLQGKLEILERVVQELNGRLKESHTKTEEQRAEATQSKEVVKTLRYDLKEHSKREHEQAGKIDRLRSMIKAQKREHDEAVEDLERDLRSKSQKGKSRLEESMQRLNGVQQNLQSEIEKLTRKNEILEKGNAKVQQQLQDATAYQDQLFEAKERAELDAAVAGADVHKIEQTMNERIARIEGEKADEIKLLRKELKDQRDVCASTSTKQDFEGKEDTDTDFEEQMQIASAAVVAAEQREKTAAQTLDEYKTQINQYKLQLRVQWMTMKQLVQEKEEYEETLAAADDQVAEANNKLQEAQEQLKEALQTSSSKGNMGSRLRKILRRG